MSLMKQLDSKLIFDKKSILHIYYRFYGPGHAYMKIIHKGKPLILTSIDQSNVMSSSVEETTHSIGTIYYVNLDYYQNEYKTKKEVKEELKDYIEIRYETFLYFIGAMLFLTQKGLSDPKNKKNYEIIEQALKDASVDTEKIIVSKYILSLASLSRE